jgi:glycosyltransferase involved in cell wall biosynthesis
VRGSRDKKLIKIAVYGVAKNEEYNVKSWYESTKNADYHFILDTGSTDNTIEVARSFGINVVSASFIPWDETMA